MKLDPQGREFYTLTITTSPTAVGGWEASFDNGATWHAGEEHDTLDDTWQWLVAGAGVAQGSAVAVISGHVQPKVRLTDNPEIVVRHRDVPTIRYGTA